ncbi:helix-turn-helix domain-containing protein [Paenibacillus spongiae]|uniref:Helix-turn-helix domain-containing protein n=1 Tax=Paenibacillus spongiae TaxID=2909671 RepID=A0ABY5SER5_9BACL|nr:helix-turn-helix transcriptional regulator [Paenibacillus spongiae]UVI31173.1 helix-turn-helix domain-containing protein [Paenibacillus spongiae]
MNEVKIVLNRDYIMKEMKRRGIQSFNELARQIGISESMFNLLMRGKRNPGSKVIGLMLSYFNVNFEKIFTEQLTKVHRSA